MAVLLPGRSISAVFTCQPISALLTCILSTAALLKFYKTVSVPRKRHSLYLHWKEEKNRL